MEKQQDATAASADRLSSSARFNWQQRELGLGRRRVDGIPGHGGGSRILIGPVGVGITSQEAQNSRDLAGAIGTESGSAMGGRRKGGVRLTRRSHAAVRLSESVGGPPHLVRSVCWAWDPRVGVNGLKWVAIWASRSEKAGKEGKSRPGWF
jgi:hypothetical protein